MSSEIVNALAAAVEAIVLRARAAGLESVPIDEFTYSWWEGDAGNGILRSGTSTEVSLRALFAAVEPAGSKLAELSALDAATRSYEASRSLMSPLLASTGRLLRYYFETAVNGALIISSDAVARTVSAYLAALEPPYEILTTILLRGISAVREFTLPDQIAARPISPADYPTLGRDAEWLNTRVMAAPPVPASRDWVVTVRQTTAIHRYGTPKTVIQRFVRSIALAVSAAAEVYVVGTSPEAFFMKGGTLFNPTPLALSRYGSEIRLSNDDIASVERVYAHLAEVDDFPSLKYLKVPLERLDMSHSRPRDEDSLVDFVIGLESLLAPDTSNLEVTFRFRLRGAAILPPHFGNAEARLALLARLYGQRSTAVHGGVIHDIRDVAARAESALGAVLLWYLTHPERRKGAKAVVKTIDNAMAAVFTA